MLKSTKENIVTGTVICGCKNIFTVRPDSPFDHSRVVKPYLECRLKGKVLKDTGGYYNPLAPGDRVQVEPDALRPGTGLIIALEERRNLFCRYNQKGAPAAGSKTTGKGNTQPLAANADLLLCMTTRVEPPFRPRFLDRVLLQAESAEIPAIILCNKIDLDSENPDPDAEERLEDFRRIGYEVIEISVKSGRGLEALRKRINGKRSVLIGQSGVGKSSLLNALEPELNIKTGPMNEKYDRGNHTTTLGQLVEISPGTQIIDTPGIRRFVPDGIGAQEVILYMREFAPLAGKCSYGLSCSHRTEPGCKIMEAVDAGVIHEDRYTSFLRIQDEIDSRGSESQCPVIYR